MSSAYCVNDTDIIYDVIDGEGVMINMKNGKYYLMNPSGTAIWSLLQKGASISQVVEAIASRFKMELQNVKSQVDAFIARLSEEKLLVTGAARPALAVAGGALAMDMFSAPLLSVFHDLSHDAFSS